MPSCVRSCAVLLVPLLLLVACDGRQADAEPHGRVSVVAAFYPLRWLAEELGGAAVDVTTLTPAGVEPHDLTLPPDSVREVESADVVLYLGEGFQPDVERAVANLGGDVEAVDLLDAEGVDLLPAPGDLGKEPLAGGEDPHVWLDPVRFSAMAEAAAGALVAADPELEATVDANLERVRADLADLDGELAAALGGCADGTILTSHAAFGYLADRYGLEQLAIAGISPEAEPDARTLAEITRSARERGVETVFFEEALPPDLSRTVADEIGAEIALLGALEFDPEEAIGAGEDYLSVMAANGEAIAEGLSCR